jgi:hypothetical protein
MTDDVPVLHLWGFAEPVRLPPASGGNYDGHVVVSGLNGFELPSRSAAS